MEKSLQVCFFEFLFSFFSPSPPFSPLQYNGFFHSGRRSVTGWRSNRPAVGTGKAAEGFPAVLQQAQRALLRQLRTRLHHEESPRRGRHLLLELRGEIFEAQSTRVPAISGVSSPAKRSRTGHCTTGWPLSEQINRSFKTFSLLFLACFWVAVFAEWFLVFFRDENVDLFFDNNQINNTTGDCVVSVCGRLIDWLTGWHVAVVLLLFRLFDWLIG